MLVAVTTGSEDDSGSGSSDVNQEAVRHSRRLEPNLVPGSHRDVIARAWLQVQGGKSPRGV